MSRRDDTDIHVWTLDDLHKAVRPSPLETPVPRDKTEECIAAPAVASSPPATSTPDPTPSPLSPLEIAFLQRVAEHEDDCLEAHWRALGVKAGSAKKRILDHLRGEGLIRVERRGSQCVVRLYAKAFELPEITPSKGLGTGGALHQALVADLAARFRSRGYDVHVEYPIGSAGKRVDLVALGTQRIGIEVGLHPNKAEHEALDNVAQDLKTGALDVILFCSPYPAMLRNVESLVRSDPYLSTQAAHIRFFRLELPKSGRGETP